MWASFQFYIILQGKTATYNLTTFMRVNITDGFTITSNDSKSEAAVRRERERERRFISNKLSFTDKLVFF